MNIKGIYKLLSNTFDEVTQVGVGVYRAVKMYENVPFAIYYFDISESIINSDFDINNYQEQYISGDYYTHPGYLQWNFYLVYICCPENIQKINKIEIEKNKIYTRKYVVTPQELTTILPTFLKVSDSPIVENSTNDDLGTNWIQMLKETQLDVVFLTEETYAEGVRRYINGNPVLQKEDKIFNNPIEEETEITSFITKIKIDEYRPYPKQKDYNLGTFNLFSGVNGCGKTSFLEAIELFYCGKTLKEKDSIQPGKIRFYFNGEMEFKYNPSDNKTFRLRDRRWYNRIYSQGNRLCESFSKYNFYDSDAGYRLSKSDNQVEIKNAFMDIALGGNITELEERIKGFYERFKTKASEFGKEKESLEKSIMEELKTIEELSFIPNEHEKLFSLIQEETSKIQWIGHIPLDVREDINIFEGELLAVQNSLKTVDHDLNWLSNISLDITNKELDTLKSKLTKLEEINTRIKSLEIKKKDLDKLVFELKELEDLLNKSEKYYSESQLLSLIGLNKQIEEESQYLSRLYSAKKLLSQIDLQIFESIEKKIDDYRYELNQQKTSYEKKKVDLNLKVNLIVQSLNEFEQLVTEIKSLGKKFILSVEKVESCPLCNSRFERDELNKRIDTYETNLDNLLLSSFQGAILDFEKDLIEIDKVLNNISMFEEVCALFFERGILSNESNLKSLVIEMEQIYGLINNTESKMKNLTFLKEYFINKGLSEDEGKTIKKTIENRIESLKFDPKFKEIFIKKRKDIIESLLRNEKDQEVNNQELSNLNNEKSKFILEEDLSDINLTYKHVGKLETSIKLLTQLTEKLCTKSDDELSQIINNIQNLHTIFEKYKQAKTENDTKNMVLFRCREKIKRYELEKKSLKSQNTKATNAFNVLDDILKNHSKKDFFQKFLVENKKEIFDIFKKIHSPREFEDIALDDDAINLKRKGEQTPIPLTQISSGQRSALALSLFLSLNNKAENGPKVILFDDPITNIDDLNILSFIDYIRFLVIEKRRQIFFATANTKLKNLLQKKFEFLQEDMYSIEFNR